jgi:hypothetical protein
MSKTYQIHVFGKPGCDKCHTLNGRLDDLLQEAEWADFEKIYHDLETESGLVEFCEAECLNPQRVPGFYVSKADPATGDAQAAAEPGTGRGGRARRRQRPLYLGGAADGLLSVGRGVITPRMIEAVLRQAKTL